MNNTIKEFEKILVDEEEILDSLLTKQAALKKAVVEKDWNELTSNVSQINSLSDNFAHVDECRDVLQDLLKTDELQPYFEKLRTLRSKLLKFKIENQSLSKYINITRDFIQEVVGNAFPESGTKVYSKTGQIVQKQPQSVVLNLTF